MNVSEAASTAAHPAERAHAISPPQSPERVAPPQSTGDTIRTGRTRAASSPLIGSPEGKPSEDLQNGVSHEPPAAATKNSKPADPAPKTSKPAEAAAKGAQPPQGAAEAAASAKPGEAKQPAPAADGAKPSPPAADGAKTSTPAAGGAKPSTPAAGGAKPSTPAAGNANQSTSKSDGANGADAGRLADLEKRMENLKGQDGKDGKGVLSGMLSAAGVGALGFGGLALYQNQANKQLDKKVAVLANQVQQAQQQPQ